MFCRAYWLPPESGQGRGRRVIAPLGTTDRAEAERFGKAFLGAILSDATPAAGPVRLGDLWERFALESGDHLDKEPRTRADTAMRAKLLVEFFGREFDVRLFTSRHHREFAQARRRGIERTGGRTKPVGARSVEADLVVLHQLLSWACTVSTGNGAS